MTALFVGGLAVWSWAADQPPSATSTAAVRPTSGPIRLFNGRDLAGLTTWLNDAQHADPRQVFTVQDGLLHISGDGLGYVRTNAAYRDYHLIVDFKWGPRTWGKRQQRAKDSGVLVHCVGPDGGFGGIFMAGIEAQIIEGGTGDFIVCSGKGSDGQPIEVSLACQTAPDRDGEAVWCPGGPASVFHKGRINWFGRDPDWADVLGYRGRRDVEHLDGQWNRLEVICDGRRVVNRLNGVIVNAGFDADPAAGQILIQTELAEIFIRRWELWPLGQAPRDDHAAANGK